MLGPLLVGAVPTQPVITNFFFPFTLKNVISKYYIFPMILLVEQKILLRLLANSEIQKYLQ